MTILLALVLVQAPPWDSLNLRTVGRWPYATSGLTVPVSESIAYAGSGPGMYILDVRDPARMVKLDSMLLPGPLYAYSLEDSLLFTTQLKAGVCVYSIAEQKAPRLLSIHGTPGMARGFEFHAPYAYAACYHAGLRIIDYTDPLEPVEVGAYLAPYDAVEDVAVQAGYAYVACWLDGFRVVDVSDPGNPSEVFSHVKPHGFATGVAVRDTIAVITWAAEGLLVWNIKDPLNPFELACLPAHHSNPILLDTLVIVGAGSERGAIVSIADPTNPRELSRFPGFPLAVRDGLCYALVDTGTLVYDISNPAAPVLLGALAEYHTYTDGITAHGDYAYTATRGQGMKVYDITDRHFPALVGELPGFRPLDIAVRDSLAYLACARATGWPPLRIVDIRDPANPVQVGSFDTSAAGHGRAVTVRDSLAFLSAGDLWILDVKNPSAPTVVARIQQQHPSIAIHNCALEGELLVTAETGLRVFDVSDPADPQELGLHIQSAQVHGIGLRLPYAYLSGGYGLQVFDLSDPTEPRLVTNYPTRYYAWSLALDWNLAYVATAWTGLRVIDVSDPTAPNEVGFYVTPSFARQVKLAHGLVYLADGDGWLSLEYYGAGVAEECNSSPLPGVQVRYDPGARALIVRAPAGLGRIRGLRVFDVSGRLVNTAGPLPTGQSEAVVPVRLRAGVHFARLITDAGPATAKFVVSR